MAGRLVLVVGPSGAGKDTLIRAAKAALRDDRRFVFPRRVVTRPADPAIEDHESVNEADFAALAGAGGFALSWRAHGLAYGVPADLHAELDAGRVAVVNGSRAVIEAARAKFPGAAVIVVDAAPEVRAQRLAGRGRESPAEITERLRRAAATVDGESIHIDNSGRLEDGIDDFVAALRGLARP